MVVIFLLLERDNKNLRQKKSCVYPILSDSILQIVALLATGSVFRVKVRNLYDELCKVHRQPI